MHGRLKVRTTAEQDEIKAKERAKKPVIFKAATERILSKRKLGQLDDEILQFTGQILIQNSDINTLWNIRKETILLFKETKQYLFDNYVSKELSFTEQCIRVNPKCYNSWFHRSWILDQGTNINFEVEFQLCDECLELDERNFHCWDYRRIIVKKSKTSLESELEFSTSKITQNVSNYSSWHYRSELLPRIFPSSSGLAQLDELKIIEECNLVKNAILANPNDQSVWIYQRWLLFSGEEIKSDDAKCILVPIWKNVLEYCQQLYDLEPNNKWVILQTCELLRRVNSAQDNDHEILKKLIDKLSKVDPLRRGYYVDFSSIPFQEKLKQSAL